VTTPTTTPTADTCDECHGYARLAREATTRGDHSAAVDHRVRIATHDSGHQGTP
jgi:hypothetical protein